MIRGRGAGSSLAASTIVVSSSSSICCTSGEESCSKNVMPGSVHTSTIILVKTTPSLGSCKLLLRQPQPAETQAEHLLQRTKRS
ncbi:unnamed protein product, partial [Amoebophrya sp. A120]|eukprot:GSA120T00016420001.1